MNNHPLFAGPDQQNLLLGALRVLGVVKVNVEFSGSGDSGNVDNAYAVNANEDQVDLSTTMLPWVKLSSNGVFENNRYVNKVVKTDQLMSVDAIIKNLCERALDESQLDWYNNDGGQGHFTIDLTNTPPTIKLYVGVNYTSTEDHNFSYYMEQPDAPVSP